MRPQWQIQVVKSRTVHKQPLRPGGPGIASKRFGVRDGPPVVRPRDVLRQPPQAMLAGTNWPPE
eukprot:1946979-Pyramimonas_sp.AAC.1